MEIEKAIDILANCIDDYVISSYCNNTCDEEVDCKNEDCIFHQAIETILREFRKQEKLIDLTIDYLANNGVEKDICKDEISKNCNENCYECIKQYFEKKANEEAE